MPGATYVYVGCAGSNDVRAFGFDPGNGRLTPLQTAPLPGQAGSSTPMAVSPDKRFLYVGIRAKPFTVACFAIDRASGRLDHLGDGPLEDSMAYLTVDRTGRNLLCASYPGHKLAVNPIGPDGVAGAPRQVLGGLPNAHAVLLDPANRYALAAVLGEDTVRLYRFDPASGQLSPNDPEAVRLPEHSGPRHMVFHPNGRILYLLCELGCALHIFDYDPDKGRLALKQSLNYKVKDYIYNDETWAGADLHLTPDARWLYTSERSTSTLTAFRLDPQSGAGSFAAQFPTETQPRGFQIDPSGRFLLAAGQLSNHVAAYAIDPASGNLSLLGRHAVGANPNWIEFVAP